MMTPGLPGGGFDGKGNAIPAEMLPAAIAYHGVEFQLAPAKTGVPDAVVAKGQAIPLPSGHYNRVYLLAASADGDQTAAFRVGAKTANLNIEDWGGFIGQWDTRIFKNQDDRNWAISAHHAPWPPADEQQREQRVPSPRYPEDYVGLEPGYVKPASLGMVRVPSPHGRWAQPAVSILLPLRVLDPDARRHTDAHFARQR